MTKIWLNVTLVDVDLICVVCRSPIPDGSTALQAPGCQQGLIVCGPVCARRDNALQRHVVPVTSAAPIHEPGCQCGCCKPESAA